MHLQNGVNFHFMLTLTCSAKYEVYYRNPWMKETLSFFQENHILACLHSSEFSRFSTKMSKIRKYDQTWTRSSQMQNVWICSFVHVNRRETSNRSLTCHFMGNFRSWLSCCSDWQNMTRFHSEVTRAGGSQMTNAELHVDRPSLFALSPWPTHTFPFPACMFLSLAFQLICSEADKDGCVFNIFQGAH